MKAISVIGRRPDLDAVAFRTYYEARHVPLALRFYRFVAYRRSYVLSLDGDLPRFAVMPEFWSADQAANQAIARSPDGETIRADERRFMGEPRMAAIARESELVAGTAGTRRLALFLRTDGADKAGLAERIAVWAGGLDTGGCRMTLDLATPMSTAGFVADAVVSLWSDADAFLPAPRGVVTVGTGRFEVSETPQERLAQSGERR